MNITTIDDADLVAALQGTHRIPVSTGDDLPHATTVAQLAAYMAAPTDDVFYDGGNTAGDVTIDLANGTLQKYTVAGAHKFTMPQLRTGASFTLHLVGAGFTPTFAGATWLNTAGKAVAPPLATAAGNVNTLVFFADNATWYGTLAGAGV